MGSIYAVGDIHGCHDKLVHLMGKILRYYKPEKDTLVFLGDYIDRGPDSFLVTEYLIRLKRKIPGIIFLKGNHEEMLNQYLTGLERSSYLSNGGRQTLESYMAHNPGSGMYTVPREHLYFYSSLSLYYESDGYIFVHAGIREKIPLEDQAPDDLLWIRSKFVHSTYDFGKRVVFGHTPFPEPLVQYNKIGIDTGAVYGNRLTCVRLPEMEFYQA
ncbi:MAG: metallophosphoesterase family protein [Desulfococcaceae bacterium]